MRRQLSTMIACLFFVSLLTSFTVNAAGTTLINPTTGNKQSFLVLSDIHFDPFTGCRTKACPLIQSLRQHPVREWPEVFAKLDNPPQKLIHDTNYALLMSALHTAKKVGANANAQFVLLLGDSLGHEFRRKYRYYSGDKSASGYQAFVYQVLSFLNQQLNAAFPTISVYTIVGNNDAYLGDYVTVADSSFFADAGKLWSNLIRNPADQVSMEKQFDYAGYYALDFPHDPTARIIFLNSNIFSYKAKGKNVEAAASRELNWLHNQLELASQHKQKVLIAMHIPEGVDIYLTLHLRLSRLYALWKSQYAQIFQNELTKFAPSIVGIFAGHLHTEIFHLSTFNHGANNIPLLGAPAISPNFGGYPGFQLYSYTTNPLQLADYITYRTS